MGKMTAAIIESLYSYGKDVYDRKINSQEATDKVVNEFKGEIAESSAKFYIDLYTDYMTGKGSTWNQNSDLALYYVEHISAETGKEFGKNAYNAAMKFARAKTKKKLISDLNELWERLFYEDHPLMPDPPVEGIDETDKSKTQEEMSMTTKECLSFINDYIASRGFTYTCPRVSHPSLVFEFRKQPGFLRQSLQSA